MCDWPLRGDRAGQTCDRDAPHRIGEEPDDLDLCSAHYRLWERYGRRPLAEAAELHAESVHARGEQLQLDLQRAGAGEQRRPQED